MPGSWSDYAENKILDHVLGGPTWTPPSTYYVALFTTAPNDAGTGGVEVSGNGYARAAVPNSPTYWPPASGGQKTNGQPVAFSQATGSWGTIVAAAIYDAPTGGNMIAWGTLGTPKAVSAGQAPQFPVGTIVVSQD